MKFLGHHKYPSSLWEQSLLVDEYDDGERLLALSPWLLKHLSVKDDNSVVKTDLKWAGVDDIDRLNIFNDYVIAYLRGLSEFAYHHQDVGYHVSYAIQQEVQRDPAGFHCVNKGQLQTHLSHLAFTEDFAEKAVWRITDNWICSQDAAHWATHFLETLVFGSQDGQYSLDYDLLTVQTLCSKSDFSDDWELSDQDEYLYKKNDHDGWSVDNWFDHGYQGQAQQGADGALPFPSRVTIRVLNFQRNIPVFQDTETDKYYFHGTKWTAVDGIMKDGILLGKKPSDFSNNHRPGFYVSNSFVAAKDWAFRNANPAIIVFKVRSDFFEGNNHLRFSNQERQQLFQVFGKFRNDGRIENRRLRRSVDHCLTITGPTLMPASLRVDHTDMRFARDVVQTCIHDVGIATGMLTFIDGVIYFPMKPSTSRRSGTRPPK